MTPDNGASVKLRRWLPKVYVNSYCLAIGHLILPHPKLRFEPRDLWIGLYHDRVINGSGGRDWRRYYVCLVPMVVLIFEPRWTKPMTREQYDRRAAKHRRRNAR